MRPNKNQENQGKLAKLSSSSKTNKIGNYDASRMSGVNCFFFVQIVFPVL